MSCVHYKFKNSLDYETLTFDGLYISVEELKRAIYEKKRIGKSTDCDLKITNAQTKEVYDEDKNLIPRNSSVIVARVPAASLQKLPKVHDTRNEGTVNKAKLFGGNSNAGPSSELPEKSNLASNDTLSEEDKIQRVLYDSSKDYLPGSYQKPNRSLMTGAPPPTYVCHKCDQGGHWITNCPNPRKVRGIPRDELVETTQDDPRAMMTTSGTYVAQKLHQEAYANPKKDKPPVWDDEETVEVAQPIPTALVPKDMLCSLCKDLFIDAVIIPCCGTSFCDSCIRTELLESESHQCPYCHSERQSPDSLVPNKFLRQAVTRFRNENATYSAKAKPSHQETLKLSLVRPKPKSPDVIIVESSLRAHNAGVGASSFLNDPDITEVEPTVKREPTQTTTDGQSKPPPERVLMPPGTTLASEMPPVPMGTFSIPVAAVAPSMVVGAAVMPPGVPIHPVYPTAQPLPPGVSQCAAALPDVKPPGLGQPLAPGVAAGPAGSRPLTVEEFYDKKQKLWESHKIDPLEEFQKFQEYRKKRDRTPASRSTSRSSDSGSASRSRSRSRSPRVGRKREDSRRVRPRHRSRSPSRSKSPVRRGRPRSRSTSRGRYRSRSRSTSRRRRRQRSFSRSRSRSRGRLPPAAGRMLPYDFFTQAMLQPMPPHQGGYNPASQFLQPPGSAYSTGFPPSVPPPQQAMGLSYPPRNVGPQMMGGIYGASANIPHFAGPLMQLPPPTNLDLSRFNQSRFYRPQRGTDVSRWQSSRPSSSRYDPKSSYRHRSPRRRDSSPTDRRDEERRRDRSPAEQKSDEKTGDSRRRKELREERGEKSSRRRSGSPSRGEEAKMESTAKTEEKVVKEKLERKKSKDDKEKERKRSNSPSARDKNPKTADDKTLSDEKAKVDDKPFLNEEKSKSDEKAKPSSAKLTKSDDRGETSKTRADHKRKRQRRTEDEKTDRADEKKETIVSPKKELKHVVEKTEVLATSVVESPVKGVKTEEAEVPVVERMKTDEEKSKPAETAVVAKEEPMEEAKSKHKRKRSYREEKSSKEALKATDSGEKEEKKSRRASKQEDSEADESGAKKSSDEKKHKKHRKKSEKKKKHRHHRKRRSASTEPSA